MVRQRLGGIALSCRRRMAGGLQLLRIEETAAQDRFQEAINGGVHEGPKVMQTVSGSTFLTCRKNGTLKTCRHAGLTAIEHFYQTAKPRQIANLMNFGPKRSELGKELGEVTAGAGQTPHSN